MHDEAPRAEDTDWQQILGLYELLRTIAPGPMVTLNRIVAVAMVHGAEAGLLELAGAERDPALAGTHRVDAVRAHLLEMSGDLAAARDQLPAVPPTDVEHPRTAYLASRATRLDPDHRV